MNVATLRNILQQMTQDFFSDATVVWGNTNTTMPHLPFVTMMLGSVRRPSKPENRSKSGVPVQIYPCTVQWTVNLFTKGQLDSDFGFDYYANTAESELIEFINYLNSEMGIQLSNRFDISIATDTVNDLSELENDTFFNYRAMTEITVGFTQFAVSKSGQLSMDSFRPDGSFGPIWHPSGSGGNSEEVATQETGYFTAVDLDYEDDPAKPEGEE